MKKLHYLLSFLLLFSTAYAMSAVTNCQVPSYSGSIKNAPSGCFDYYVFEQTWVPQFCATGNRDTLNDCKNLPNTWSADNFSVHGLWPNYKAINGRVTYPIYCKISPGCNGSKACSIEFNQISQLTEQQLQTLVAVNRSWLLNHEWEKHGTCSGLTQPQYFQTLVLVANRTPTPKLIKKSIGKSLSYQQIIKAYGGQAWINIYCHRSRSGKRQYLKSIRTYWNKALERIKNPGKTSKSCNASKPIFIRKAS